MFGRNNRFVFKWEWLTLLPDCFVLPHRSHIAMTGLSPLRALGNSLSCVANAAPDSGLVATRSRLFPRTSSTPQSAQRLTIVARFTAARKVSPAHRTTAQESRDVREGQSRLGHQLYRQGRNLARGDRHDRPPGGDGVVWRRRDGPRRPAEQPGARAASG